MILLDEVINKTKSCLGSYFHNEMGEASYVLGIKITRDQTYRLLYLNQSEYIERVRRRFSIDNCKALSIHVCKG